jgi:GT2 family glycosyltransferase/glycosyltransferase involved in cell wall biosynthesis/protein-L-isoaspartate O-methyltransferase
MGTGTPGDRLIEWTGERCVPWTDDLQVIYEHYHRYAFALRFTEGKRVLDLASGEGYGAALMAAKASRVVGLELDETTVAHARGRYPLDNLAFEAGSITDPDALAAEAPFDVITCFEAVEHVAEQELLMRLVRNRLAPGGVFLCSTPDVVVYTHDHGNDNPFHVHELTQADFRALLAESFRHTALLRQNVAVGSLIHGDESGSGAEFHTLHRESTEQWRVSAGAPHTYLIGIASAEPIAVPCASVLVDEKLTMVARAVATERDRVARELGGSAERAEADLRGAEEAAARIAAQLAEAVTAGQRAAGDRDAAIEQARLAQEERARVSAELVTLRGKAGHDAARVAWLADNNSRLAGTVGELAADNATLRAQQSAIATRLIGRYRTAVERLAPRGTHRRDLYESAFGRPTGRTPEAAVVPGPVAVTTSEHPIASVIIPTYGNWAYTRRCLESIQLNLPGTPFEIVVVDDASVDDSADRVAQCAGVRLVRAPRNLGFIGACNLGARSARGELLLFLNNDTEVRAGWLEALVDVVETRPDVGLVGSRLVYPDGRLQECGGIIWADGTGWNYGRNESPDQPEYRTLRDVDYCSGAALLVRRELFERIGGFDTRYAPAYYEDTDLAFAVRAAGYRTMVQPESVVVHHEGVSNGTDLGSGIKRYQEINRAAFVEKWADALADHLPEASPRNVWLGRQRTGSGHGGGIVLVADHQVPRPDEDSGSVRMARLLELLVQLGHRVVFFPLNHAVPETYTAWLHRTGVTVVADAVRQIEFVRDMGRDLTFALLSRPHVAWQLLEQVREHAPHCRIAYDTVDLHFLRLQRQADLAAELGDTEQEAALRRRAAVLRELELGLARTTDVTFTVSDVECELLGELVPSARVAVLSNVHTPDSAPAVPAGRSGVLFVGSFDHVPNRDAARWLASEIMPLVRRQRPDAVAHIVGSNPPPEILALAGEGVVVHGWVADLAARYRQARVVVAPLRFGAGVKGKVGESLGHGVPVVGTPLAAEGMHLNHGEDVLLGGTAAELAGHLVTLLGDDDLWQRLSDAGRATVSRRFGPEVARRTLSELIAGPGH